MGYEAVGSSTLQHQQRPSSRPRACRSVTATRTDNPAATAFANGPMRNPADCCIHPRWTPYTGSLRLTCTPAGPYSATQNSTTTARRPCRAHSHNKRQPGLLQQSYVIFPHYYGNAVLFRTRAPRPHSYPPHQHPGAGRPQVPWTRSGLLRPLLSSSTELHHADLPSRQHAGAPWLCCIPPSPTA